MVYGRGSSGGSDGLHPGARLHGHQALRLRHLGADSAAARRGIQAHRPPEREHADAHSGEPTAQGSGSRRGLRAGSRVGHAGRHRAAGRASGGSPDERDDLLHDVRQVGAELARPAAQIQPVVLRHALGEDDPPVPAHGRVPLAGGSHRPRHRRGGAGGDDADAARLPRLLREEPRDSGLLRPEERKGKVCRRARDVFRRGDDAGRQGAAKRHEPQLRHELLRAV